MLIFNFRNALRALPLAAALCGSYAALAQQYKIATLAGGAPPATPVTAVNTSIGTPHNAAVDPAGKIYFSSGNSVFKLSTSGSITLFAGNSRVGYSGDGGPALKAQLNQPLGIALDASGDVYIADSLNNVVRMVSPAGIISTVAGNGVAGYSGDGGPATAVDPTIQGMLTNPYGVAVDKKGNLYIADNGNHAIRIVTMDGNINTFAGNQTFNFGYSGDGSPANQGQLDFPTDVAVDTNGNVYIADYGNFVIRQVTTDGNIHTYAGNDTNGYSGDGAGATSASLYQPFGIAVDSSGNLYISEYGDSRIRKVASGSNGAGGNISTIAGNGNFGFGGDGAAATSAQMNIPRGLAVDSSGNIYVADWGNNRVRKIASSNISTVAGNGVLSYSGDDGPATQAQFNVPSAVAVDSSGNVYVADTANNVVRQVASTGVISTFAGTGSLGFSGDGGAANKAQLNAPQGVAVDASGNVYIADTGNLRVRVVGAGGNISTFAGSGSPGYAGDNGPAASATFYQPDAVATDKSGNVYIADYSVGVVRKVSGSGTITTVAGNGGTGYGGDGGPATAAQLNGPSAIAVDPSGNLYIAQLIDSRVRMVSTAGTISTIAGNGSDGYTGEGMPAVASELAAPAGVAADGNGNVFISMTGDRVMKVSPDGTMSTIAGTGLPGYSGDGGPAYSALLNIPQGIALDSSGNLYIADSANNAVRMLSVVGSGLSVTGVTNGASNRTGTLSPGSIVVVIGSVLGPAKFTNAQFGTTGEMTTNLAGTRILFNGTPAPILYIWATQVSAVVPFGLTGSTAQVVVQFGNQTAPPVPVTLAPTAPALFTANSSGQGQALANNADGTANAAGNPAKAGSTITLFATGTGSLSPSPTDGTVLFAPLPETALPVTATIGGQAATVQSAGGISNNVAGSVQIAIQIPAGTASGTAVPIVIQAGGVSSPAAATIAVQ